MSRLTVSTSLLLLSIALTAPSHGICAPKSDADKRVKGNGVIDRVIASGSEPVFRADGYTFRILPATEVRLGKGLQTLSEVGTNTWANFEGKIDESGTIVATKAAFAVLKVPRIKPDPNAVQVTTFPPDSKIDADNGFAAGSSPFPPADHGGWCGWYDIHRDPADQEHIRRLGLQLVPQYQRELPANDPAKIPFRFYEVEEKQYRSPIFCGNGLILIPTDTFHRLENEDELAALVADGVAGALQSQAEAARGFTWMDAAEMASNGAFGMAGVIASEGGRGGGLIMRHKVDQIAEHQRGRMALALLADAGFDPRQAPETWLLLKPSHLPKDHSQLDYPERSRYLQNILETQYKTGIGGTAPAGHPATGTPIQ
jgi:hypothetical protein